MVGVQEGSMREMDSYPNAHQAVSSGVTGSETTLSVRDALSSSKFGGSRVELSRASGATTKEPAAAGTLAPGAGPILPKKETFYDLFWRNKHATSVLCCVFWTFGMCVAFLGPTLLDLGCKTTTIFATMSWVFFSQSLFILLGSAFGGLLANRFTPNVMLLVGTAAMTITMAIIPLCQYLVVLALVLAIMGFFMGTIDTVANVSMIRIYGKDVSPFLQALHFFYGVGAFVSPMIAQPFLLNEDCSPFIDSHVKPITDLAENETLPAATLKEAQEKTHIDYAFWIMALLMVPVVVLTSTLAIKQLFRHLQGKTGTSEVAASDKQNQYESMDSGETNETTATDDRSGTGRQVTTFQVILITLLAAGLMFLYDGLQAIYGGYVYSYAVKGPVRLRKSDAAYLNALFWGTFAGGRLFSIPLATRLAPAFMLLCNITGCTTGIILMLSMSESRTMLIVGTCMMGAFMSSVFPTALSLTEQYINVTPTITSILVFGAALGEMSMPVILGHEFDRAGPITFLVTGLVLCVLSLIVYVALWIAGHSVVRYAASPPGILGLFSTCMPGKANQESESSGLMTQHVRYYSRMRSDLSESSIGEQYGDPAYIEDVNQLKKVNAPAE